jgi:hypothetical protein
LIPHPYLDPGTKEVPASEFKRVAQPKDVSLTFEFQTRGAPNSRATKVLEDQVKHQIQECGLFGKIQPQASPEVSWLSITLNNVPITDQGDAASKGFVTGLTFGLAGTAVTDGYVCTVSYLAPGMKAPIVKTSRHAIHTTIGNASPPVGAIAAESPKEAAMTMVRQVLSQALRDLSFDDQF